jgi:hypothetical protein
MNPLLNEILFVCYCTVAIIVTLLLANWLYFFGLPMWIQ